MADNQNEQERLRRWRLALGEAAHENLGAPSLEGQDAGMDRALGNLYNADRSGGMGRSSPNVARWLGDIRTYFPSSVVQVMQKDAIEKLNLTQLLLEPEMLQTVEPDVHLVTTLMSLSRVIPAKTKDTARQVVRKLTDQLSKRLKSATVQAVSGSLRRAAKTTRPRDKEIDWNRTIRANLKNYLPDRKIIIPEKRVGWKKGRSSLRDIVLCVDQSGSMAPSVVYASVFAAVLASLPAIHTRMVLFDTAVVDLTDEIDDPVDLLFGSQLGGGTDINKALAYCQTRITKPNKTILVLISDLYEGGNSREMLARAKALVQSGVKVIALLALSDEGAPFYDHNHAAIMASMGIPAFACTPDLFPELMAAAIEGRDLGLWAARNDVPIVRPQQ